MSIEILPFLLAWGLGTAACYKSIKGRDNEEFAFVDFIGSLIFWPLMLTVFSAHAAWCGGKMFSEKCAAWLEEKRRPKAFRSGADNGLYD